MFLLTIRYSLLINLFKKKKKTQKLNIFSSNLFLKSFTFKKNNLHFYIQLQLLRDKYLIAQETSLTPHMLLASIWPAWLAVEIVDAWCNNWLTMKCSGMQRKAVGQRSVQAYFKWQLLHASWWMVAMQGHKWWECEGNRMLSRKCRET